MRLILIGWGEMGGPGYGKNLGLPWSTIRSVDCQVWGRFLMVWGCAPAQGVDHVYTIDRRMDAELHTSILQVEFLAIVEFCGWDKPQLTFQQDYDPKDTFK